MDDWNYSFSLPERVEGKPVTAEEAERILVARLEEEDPRNALWELARFYSLVGRQEEALGHVERLADLCGDPEDQAACFLAMGQLMEQQSEYEAALRFYRGAFRLEPVNNRTWYLINNNLGYCLNHFGRNQEAEPLCRAAIRIDPLRHNAYKNLGICLEGQGRYAEAAKAFVGAVRANASDERAFHHLSRLLVAHRHDVALAVPDIDDLHLRCRDAVDAAQAACRKPRGG